MTVVAVLLVPVVLAYQAWTYWVLRARLGKATFEEVRNPIDLVAKVTGGTPGGGGPIGGAGGLGGGPGGAGHGAGGGTPAGGGS